VKGLNVNISREQGSVEAAKSCLFVALQYLATGRPHVGAHYHSVIHRHLDRCVIYGNFRPICTTAYVMWPPWRTRCLLHALSPAWRLWISCRVWRRDKNASFHVIIIVTRNILFCFFLFRWTCYFLKQENHSKPRGTMDTKYNLRPRPHNFKLTAKNSFITMWFYY